MLIGTDEQVMISISDTGDEPPVLSTGFHDILYMQFDDIEDDSWHGWKGIDDAQAREIAKFILYHTGKDIWVHCFAGISRSAGVVVAVCRAFPEYIAEDQSAWDLPNKRVASMVHKYLSAEVG